MTTSTPTTAKETILDGRFRIKRKVSQGAQGTVFEAIDAKMSTSVAIKYVSAKMPGYDRAAQRLEAEYDALAKLSTVRDVINALGIVRQSHGTYLVLEWVDALDAAATLAARGPLDFQTWSWVARALLGALAEAHLRHVLHCDVKPQNILLGRGVFRLIDFGIAENIGFVQLEDKSDLQGTMPYLPPERVLGIAPAPSGDVFSAGATLFELLTGRLPFEGDTPGDVQSRKIRGEYSDVTALNPDAPSWLNDWFARMLAPQPEQRVAGAREALALLNANAPALVPSLRSLLRACERCGAELWRAIPFCTHCGHSYAIQPVAGDSSVIVWKAENKQALAEQYEGLTGRSLSTWRKSLYMAEYPRVFLYKVDAATANVAVEAFGNDHTSLTVSKTPYQELLKHFRLSSVQQGVALVSLISLVLFLVLYATQLSRTQSAAMGFELAILLMVSLASIGYVAFNSALQLVPGAHLVADQGLPVAIPLIRIPMLLKALVTPGARAKASRLVRRVQEVHAFVAKRHLAPELKQEFMTKLGDALRFALQGLRQTEERTLVIQHLRSQGARKQRATLQGLIRSEKDKPTLARLLKRIESLTAAEHALTGAEADVSRAESDYANIFSGINELYLLAAAGNEDALRKAVALLPRVADRAEPLPEHLA